SGEYWQRQKTLLTEREVRFMKGLFRIVDMKRWYLCPQVRVADIARLNGNIRPRSRQWWQLFRMVSQWHVDVVIVERRSFSIVAAVELDDASHLRPERRRRDILLEEVLRQAGIPLLRSHDARKLLQMTGEWLDTFRTDLQSEPGSSRSENMHRFTRQHQVSETAVRKVKSDSCMEGNK
ncbi:DUF2726 domain-containing protein, partial [Escherichia coli]|nr:DUF2726 domain-containing protein [Escherichia coli]EEU9913722.1 DUF2726 domain-containing protein [Escherichia coli]